LGGFKVIVNLAFVNLRPVLGKTIVIFIEIIVEAVHEAFTCMLLKLLSKLIFKPRVNDFFILPQLCKNFLFSLIEALLHGVGRNFLEIVNHDDELPRELLTEVFVIFRQIVANKISAFILAELSLLITVSFQDLAETVFALTLDFLLELFQGLRQMLLPS